MEFTKMSDKERAKKYRDKHKDRIKEKNKERMRSVRAKQKAELLINPLKQEMYKKRETMRKKLYRERQKSSAQQICPDNDKYNLPSTSNACGSYRSPQTFGKAVKKSLRALPKSPTKQVAVVSKLAAKCGLKLQLSKKKPLDSNKSVQLTVCDFFYRSDIVYTSPGMKDEITTWKEGKKIKLRKYYLVMFLKEAYAVFKDTHPEIIISFSTFCKLRPENVCLLHETPIDQCRCITCENFFLILKSLKISYDSKKFWKQTLCDDSANSHCWQGICESCSNGEKIKCDEAIESTTTWKRWGKSEGGKLKCNLQESCIGEVLTCFKETFSTIARHLNTKRIQSDEFQKDKSDPNIRILQLDFAMNYSCEYQNEVQSALWSRSTVTLFTAAVFSQGLCTTFLICSDVTEKGKNTVQAFIELLYKELDPISPQNKHLEEVIWTDGPSSEFKNRFMASFLQELSRKYQKTFCWKYFATSHGKGVVDGIGGKAKSIVRQTVMSKSASAKIVQSASDFYSLVKVLMPSTTILFVEEKDILRDNERWNNALPVANISKLHVMRCTAGGELNLFQNALAPNKQVLHVHKEEMNITLGSWVLVSYDGQQYPGEVTQIISAEEFEVNVMERCKNSRQWKWPKHEDKLYYKQESIVKKIRPPEIVNARGFFKFLDEI